MGKEAQNDCRKRLQKLRERYEKSAGSAKGSGGDGMNEAITKFSAAHPPPPRRPRRCCCCPCVHKYQCLRLFAVLFALYVIHGGSPEVQLRVNAFMGRYAYIGIMRPGRFLLLPLVRNFPDYADRIYRRADDCIIPNPLHKHKEPSLADLGTSSERKVKASKTGNCACLSARYTVFQPAKEAFSQDNLHQGGIPSILDEKGPALSNQEFLEWYRDTKDALKMSTCVSVAHDGSYDMEYETPEDLNMRLTGPHKEFFFGMSLMMCPGSMGEQELIAKVRSLPEALGAGYVRKEMVWVSIARRGDYERPIESATPFDMSSGEVRSLVRVTAITGSTRLRFSPLHCTACQIFFSTLEPGMSAVYNSSVWQHDQIILNKHDELSATVLTAYRWPWDDLEWSTPGEDEDGIPTT